MCEFSRWKSGEYSASAMEWIGFISWEALYIGLKRRNEEVGKTQNTL